MHVATDSNDDFIVLKLKNVSARFRVRLWKPRHITIDQEHGENVKEHCENKAFVLSVKQESLKNKKRITVVVENPLRDMVIL